MRENPNKLNLHCKQSALSHSYISISAACAPPVLDEELSVMNGFLVGANEKDYHLKNVKYGRDFKGKVCDIRLTKDGDLCPCCKKPLKFKEGIWRRLWGEYDA